MPEVQKIALGHNNVLQLKPFYLLSPPLLGDYLQVLEQEWHTEQGQLLNAGRYAYKPWGKPWVRITFKLLSKDEVAYLRTLSGFVTYRGLDEGVNEWANFNGTVLPARLSEIPKRRPMREGFYVDIIDLEAL